MSANITIVRTAVLAALLTVQLAGCTEERVITQSATIPFDAKFRNQTSGPEDFGDFQVSQITTRSHFKTSHIMGRVKNLADKPYQYVQISVDILDDSGNLVDTFVANRAGLKPHQVWKFDIPIQRPEAFSKFRVASVTGW